MRDVNAYLSAQQTKGTPERAEEWAKLEEYYNKKYVKYFYIWNKFTYSENELPSVYNFTLWKGLIFFSNSFV